MTTDTHTKGRPPGYDTHVHICDTGGLTVMARRGRFTHLHRLTSGSMRAMKQDIPMSHEGFLRWQDPTGRWHQKTWVSSNVNAKPVVVDELPDPPPGPPVQDIDAAIRYAYLGRTPGDLDPHLKAFLETTEALALAVNAHPFRTEHLGDALMAYEVARSNLMEAKSS